MYRLLFELNRPVPNGMPGGVRGGKNPSYSICVKILTGTGEVNKKVNNSLDLHRKREVYGNYLSKQKRRKNCIIYIGSTFFRFKLETFYDENTRLTLLPYVLCYIVLRKKLRKFHYNRTYQKCKERIEN